jgi:hypothetical protein
VCAPGEKCAIECCCLMLRFSRTRLWLALAALGAALAPVRAIGQDEPSETPLGDVARNLRKKPPKQAVIDDDNLTQVLQQVESRRGFGASLRYLMSGDGSGFRVSAPDVTCNLSFSSNVKALLAKQYSEMELPASDVARLEGHATLADGALTVSVHNGTDWHVSEISVAFTLINNHPGVDGPPETAVSQPLTTNDRASREVRADKKPDTTVIYRMRAVGVPWSVTSFSSRLTGTTVSNGEWHWAVVSARGYPPESYRREMASQGGTDSDAPSEIETLRSTVPVPEKRPEITPVLNGVENKPQLVPSSSPH